jgi:hypothetical protein
MSTLVYAYWPWCPGRIRHHMMFFSFCNNTASIFRPEHSYGIPVSQMTTDMICYVITSRSFPNSWLIAGFLTRVTRWVQLVEQELLTLPEHMLSTRFLGDFFWGGVRVVQSLIFCEVPCRSLFVFLSFSIGNCIVCTSAIYGFLPTLLLIIHLFSSTDCTARYLYNYHKHLSV